MDDTQVLYGFLWLLASLGVYVWVAASMAAVFAKAGEEPWQGWIPVLNMIVLLRVAGLSGWLVLVLLVPVAGLVLIAWTAHRVNRSFGHGAGMTVLAVVLFPVWTSILGWGSSRWIGSETSPSGPMRRGTSVALDARIGADPAVVPPRPPAPAAPGPPPVQQRSALRSPSAAGADADLPLGRSHAPYTGTSPIPPAGMPAASSSPAPAEPRRAFTPAEHDPAEPFASPASARAFAVPAPVGSVPPAPPSPTVDPWAPQKPTRSARPQSDEAAFGDSAEVSAVVGAPSLGQPRAARESVSAQHGEPELPDSEAAFDETIITARRRTPWMLALPLGAPLAITADVLIVGRRPGFDPDFPDAQLIPVSDETRTMSKTHARLELQGDVWTIVDLDSTNGVILVAEDGTEVDATPGVPERLTERFLLGDAELRLTRAEQG